MAELLVALESVSTSITGEAREIRQGDRLPADDPLVKKLPHIFGPIEATSDLLRAANVEQATAAPGEKRDEQPKGKAITTARIKGKDS